MDIIKFPVFQDCKYIADNSTYNINEAEPFADPAYLGITANYRSNARTMKTAIWARVTVSSGQYNGGFVLHPPVIPSS